MNFYRMTLILTVATSLLLCGTTFAKPGNDDAPPTVDVNITNHLGPQVQSNLVTIRTGNGSDCPGGFGGAREINDVSLPDGTIDYDAFTVPTGHVFVITDVQFRLSLGGHPGENIMVRLGVPCGAGCMIPLVDATVLLLPDQGGTHVSLRHGLRVNPGVTLCVADVNQASPNAFATVHGYFAPNQ